MKLRTLSFSLAVLAPTLALTASSSASAALPHVAPVTAYASPIPLRATPRAQLETDQHKHHQVLRVKRDFGDSFRDIVVDAWVPKNGASELTEVRLWWVESNQGDIRKPFGKKTKKRVKVSYQQHDAQHWTVTFGAGSKKFDFDVEIDDGGTPQVYANIKAGRAKVDRCRVDAARLYAKKLADVTVGLDRLEVDCVDAQGNKHTGDLRKR